MSLKYKISLFVFLLFLVSGLASVAVNHLVILPSFQELERQQGERNTSRAAEAINRDLEVLSTNVTAWAQWDESKRFMTGANDAFVESELSAEAVASAEVSYMGFYRANGTQVIHRAPAAETPGSPGLGVLQDASLPAGHPLLQHADIRGDARGLLATPSGPMLVASRPILSSNGEGPAAGVLIFGRLLDAATIDRIADQYKLDFSIVPATGAGSVESEKSPPPAGPPGESHLTAIRLTEMGSILLGEHTLNDVHGDPILTLRVTMPRDITERGREASRFALATLCAVALAVLGVLLGVVHVLVLHPIAKITAHAVEMGKDDARHERLALQRKDELGVLAAEFDRMTDHLVEEVEVRQRLIDQSFLSGKAGMAAGILHNIGNAVTPIMVRLNTLSDHIKSAPGDDLERAVAELESADGAAERRADLTRFVQLAGLELASLARDAHEHVRGAIIQIEHVQQILNAQERYSRAGSIAEPVEIEPIVRRVVAGLSPDLLQLVSVDVDPSMGAIGIVRGDRVEIQQVVGNLILNAAESIKSHHISDGRVRVQARRELASDPPLAHLIIEDNGAGIGPADLAKMFRQAFSTKRRGSGLGLHWSANSVAAMGGRLYAESPGVGKGATLHLLLPLAGESSTGSANAVRGQSG